MEHQLRQLKFIIYTKNDRIIGHYNSIVYIAGCANTLFGISSTNDVGGGLMGAY